MTRELEASAVLSAAQLPLLALHRWAPEHALPDLLAASGRVQDGVRLMLFHLQACPSCVPAALEGARPGCDRGARLLESAHGYRPRPEPA